MISNLEDVEEVFLEIGSFISYFEELKYRLRHFKKESFFTEEEYKMLIDLKNKMSEAADIADEMYSLVD